METDWRVKESRFLACLAAAIGFGKGETQGGGETTESKPYLYPKLWGGGDGAATYISMTSSTFALAASLRAASSGADMISFSEDGVGQ